ncbi:MAG: T9SS type A sorting domain-containing protein [Ignavibacteria bacterium]|nr:T9SS type A sorting domain-containing protein [Ignavibacteria bacterium]
MFSRCFPENDPSSRLVKATVTIDPDTNYFVLGKKVRGFFLSGEGLTRYATIFGPWNDIYSETNYRYTTTLCGALIEGKYYGDSACLVASSTPLQSAEFAALAPSLAPNPVSDIATLRFVLPTAQGVTIEMYDMLGREVVPSLRFEALSSGMNALPIEMASLPRGVYAVRLRTALGLRATTMMVKE